MYSVSAKKMLNHQTKKLVTTLKFATFDWKYYYQFQNSEHQAVKTDLLILRQTLKVTNVKIGEKRHNAINILQYTNKHHIATNVITDKPHNATNVI